MKQIFLLLPCFLLFISSCIPSGQEVQPDPVNPSGGGTTGGSTGGTSSTLSISGKITYDSVPASNSGLNYAGTARKPLRKIAIELVNATNDQILSTSNTDYNGAYSFSYSSLVSKIYIRIRAEIKSPQIVVEDNTNQNAIYVVESADYSVSQSTTLPDIHLPSGWSTVTNSYSSSRVSGPFAILDTVLSAIDKVSGAKPSLVFPSLKINWSINNTSESGNKALGKIGTSHYSPSEGELYILGKANVDTDEFDTHVVVHEWGHYFEDQLGRSDSIGGQHGSGDEKDIALAFGEGWGNALSAMVLDPLIIYRDSMGQGQSTIGVIFSLESSSDPSPGWFSEISVQEILFDLFDSSNMASDNISLGLSPIIDVMTTHQKTTRAITSIFSFINGLKTKYPSSANAINSLTSSKSISNVSDDFGTGETNSAAWTPNLPVYRSLTYGASPLSATMWGEGLIYNDIGNNRLFKFTATKSSTTMTLSCEDTCIFDIIDGKNIIYSDFEVYTGTPITLTKAFTTVSGTVYIIRVQTDGNYVTTPDIFNIALEID